MDERYIGKLERGAVRWPGRDYRSALRAILGTHDDSELGFQPPSRDNLEAVRPKDTRPATMANDVAPWDLVDSLTRGAVSDTALDHAERVAVRLAESYPSTPPRVLLRDMSLLTASINNVLKQPQRVRSRQRAASLLCLLTGLCGNLWLDLGNHARAHDYFDVSDIAAYEADNDDLATWALTTRSIAAYFEKQYSRAHALLDRAEATAGNSTYRRRAWIAALRARADAAAGQPAAARSALDRAYEHVSNVSDPPVGTDFFDPARLDGLAGTVYLLLPDTTQASQLLQAAVGRRSPADIKGRALTSLDLARCHAVDREPEEAVRVATAALDIADGSFVQPINVKAHEVISHLEPWNTTRAVQDLKSRVVALAHA